MTTARPSDRFIPWYFVLFFVVLTVVFAGFAYIARSTHPGLVTEKAYDKGLKYNNVIARAEAQEKLGWTSTLTTKFDNGHAVVSLSLKDAKGQPLESAQVSLWFIRPVQAGMDVKEAMQPASKGVYAGRAVLPARGLWDVRIEAVKGDARYQTSKRAEF